MPAPTALLEPANIQHDSTAMSLHSDDLILDVTATLPLHTAAAAAEPHANAGSNFLPAAERHDNLVRHVGMRRIYTTPHRFCPIRRQWPRTCAPLCEHQVCMDGAAKTIELRTHRFTRAADALQKGNRALVHGFDVTNPVVLLRLDDL
ncbi:Uu.00g089770.m01.CDS01 [Anthostomella pinea]|uniref:Uu.00g089770.m01.CDS01 n=1 Tax=Anthostomella pinea TaxID=933095 RepID=A0AAI8VMP7_9PEZI|nr:Uu.00g089770.m01.CDS01 [Anthostomella pinea]